MSTFDLKCIAVLSMLIDHMGAYIFPDQVWMRYVGRLAFPIYCFLLVQGFLHTKDVKKYLGRLFLFALISEVPYDLIWSNELINFKRQNVFFTLFLGLLAVCVLAWLGNIWIRLAALAVIALLTHFVVKPDYGLGGLAMIVCFYLFRGERMIFELGLSIGAINIGYYGGIQSAAVVALFPIYMYNGKKGPSAKYFFYAFYPVHLLLLYLIRRYFIYVT
jgi:hypothetical protein